MNSRRSKQESASSARPAWAAGSLLFLPGGLVAIEDARRAVPQLRELGAVGDARMGRSQAVDAPLRVRPDVQSPPKHTKSLVPAKPKAVVESVQPVSLRSAQSATHWSTFPTMSKTPQLDLQFDREPVFTLADQRRRQAAAPSGGAEEADLSHRCHTRWPEVCPAGSERELVSARTSSFDKSALQSLSVNEAVWLDAFYRSNITPLFFVEPLAAGLARRRRASSAQCAFRRFSPPPQGEGSVGASSPNWRPPRWRSHPFPH
jgi:hypothetical protein